MTPAAEFNVWADPRRRSACFTRGLDVTMIGLDVTHQALRHARDRRAPACDAGRVGDVRRGAGRVLQRLPPRDLRLGRRADPRRRRCRARARARTSSRRGCRNVEVELESELCRGPHGRRPVAAHGQAAERARRRRSRRRARSSTCSSSGSRAWTLAGERSRRRSAAAPPQKGETPWQSVARSASAEPSRARAREEADAAAPARTTTPSCRASAWSRSASSSRACSGWAGTAAPSASTSRRWLDARLGLAAYVAAARARRVGGLMLARSALVDVPPVPHRAGVVGAVGLLLALGKEHGGIVGCGARRRPRAASSARPGAPILGVTLLVAGALLLTGASVGALLRRSGHASRRARLRGRRSLERPPPEPRPAPPAVRRAGASQPRRRSTSQPTTRTSFAPAAAEPPPLARARRRASETDGGRAASSIRRRRRPGEYRLPDRTLLRKSPPAAKDASATSARTADAARADARALRRRGDARRPDRRPARDALRAAARARHEGVEGRAAEGRPLLRARDDRDPHPRADPGQAGGRRRGAEPRAETRHARRHLRRPALDGEPALRLARQGHLRQRRLDRPRPHAAPADRRHDRARASRAASTRSSRRSSCARRPTRCG